MNMLKKIAIAQINSVCGDFQTNSNKIIDFLQKAEISDCALAITPEKSLCGYGLNDTLKKFPYLVNSIPNYIKEIAQKTKLYSLIGYCDVDYNSIYALVYNGKVLKTISQNSIIEIEGIKYAIILNQSDLSCIKDSDICIYTESYPVGIENKQKLDKFLTKISDEYKKTIIHINPVGATDSLSFDGRSIAYNSNKQVIARCKSFDEDLGIIDFNGNNIIHDEIKYANKDCFDLNYEDSELEYIYRTVLQGVKDYFQKCGIKRAVLGLSGGLDSTVCAVILTDALGKENVFGVSMPSKLTSAESKSDAKILAQNLGIGFSEVTIKPMFETTSECFNTLFGNVEKFWDGRYKQSFTPDNIQARSRAIYLWGIANEFSSCIPIATSDKSEAYMGYATINGDMSGGFAPILDITKTKLFALARWLNKSRKEKNAIPESIILKKPGAELAIDPNTGKTLNAEDALMPYEFMDEIIWRIEKKQETYSDMLNSEFVYEKQNNISQEQKKEWINKFFKRMSGALYKATIMPPSIITNYPTNIKPAYFQPITSGHINYKIN
ncbi:MAG: NAD(+) synthase [bacterium]|nr:NAD(+) synthase [bacterium]